MKARGWVNCFRVREKRPSLVAMLARVVQSLSAAACHARVKPCSPVVLGLAPLLLAGSARAQADPPPLDPSAWRVTLATGPFIVWKDPNGSDSGYGLTLKVLRYAELPFAYGIGFRLVERHTGVGWAEERSVFAATEFAAFERTQSVELGYFVVEAPRQPVTEPQRVRRDAGLELSVGFDAFRARAGRFTSVFSSTTRFTLGELGLGYYTDLTVGVSAQR